MNEINEYEQPGSYFDSYDNISVHNLMLRDDSRVSKYKEAILNSKNLFKDKVKQILHSVYSFKMRLYEFYILYYIKDRSRRRLRHVSIIPILCTSRRQACKVNFNKVFF